MPLTDMQAKNAKPSEKTIRLYDLYGLYLEISPSGGKWWRIKYRFGGKEKRFSLGTYPEVSLKEARIRRDRARELLREGIDPSRQKQEVKAARAEEAVNTFEKIAWEWFDQQAKNVWTEGHARTVRQRLDNDVIPWIGPDPITTLTAPKLLTVLRRVEERGAIESAHRIHIVISQVFRYAVLTGRAERNPAADLRGALPPSRPTHMAAITDPKKLGELLLKLDGYKGSQIVRTAVRLVPLVFVRPGELRHARWEDIDLDAAVWKFVATKTKTEHVVPLSKQAVALLRELDAKKGKGVWVFHSPRSKARPMSNNAVLAALRSLGVEKDETCVHGFRATARTLIAEELHDRYDLIEHQLSHKVRDPLGRAYNRTEFLEERRLMMQKWSDYLDRLLHEAREEAKKKPQINTKSRKTRRD